MSSSYSHVRSLLRDLENPERLRGNPLAAPFFAEAESRGVAGGGEREAVAHLRSHIASSLAAFDSGNRRGKSAEHLRRQRTIVSHCDLGGEPHKNVAAALGISMRQFYRERTSALGRLAAELARPAPEPRTPPGAAVSVAPSGVSLLQFKIDAIDALFRRAQYRAAADALNDMIRTAPEPGWRIVSLCRLSLVLGALAEYDQSERAFIDARSIKAPEGGEFDRGRLRFELQFGAMMNLWRRGAYADAVAVGQQIVSLLESPAREGRRYALDAMRLALVNLGSILQERGSAQQSLETIERARRLATDDRAVPAEHRLDVVTVRAQTLVMLPGQHARALTDAREGLVVAQANGLPHQTVDCLLAMALVHEMTGEFRLAVEHARLASRIARDALAGEDLCEALLLAARFENASDQAHHALALIGEVRRCEPYATRFSSFVRLRESESFLRIGRAADAREAAGEAAGDFEARGVGRYHGLSLLARAKAEDASGEAAAAVESLEAALPLLEGSSLVSTLAEAYEVSARLTGDRVRASLARDLRGGLQAEQGRMPA